MDEAKQQMLANIRGALQNVPDNESPADVTVQRSYRRNGSLSPEECVDLFERRVNEYKANVHRVEGSGIAGKVSDILSREMIENLVIPEGFPDDLIPEFITPLRDDPESMLSHQQLDGSDGVITLCTRAIAQTGTLILDAGEGQGRRALTLLPDYHLCIVRADQIVELVPEGFAHFESIIKDDGPPLTFISGPSATSDIELSRVEGVHGPRTLEIIIVH